MSDVTFPRFEYFVSSTTDGPRWFWRLKAANGQIIAIGGEGFVTTQSLRTSLANVIAIFPIAAKKPLVLL